LKIRSSFFQHYIMVKRSVFNRVFTIKSGWSTCHWLTNLLIVIIFWFVRIEAGIKIKS
jgi:hypothetical protein